MTAAKNSALIQWETPRGESIRSIDRSVDRRFAIARCDRTHCESGSSILISELESRGILKRALKHSLSENVPQGISRDTALREQIMIDKCRKDAIIIRTRFHKMAKNNRFRICPHLAIPSILCLLGTMKSRRAHARLAFEEQQGRVTCDGKEFLPYLGPRPCLTKEHKWNYCKVIVE